jgi:hypothetical protein
MSNFPLYNGTNLDFTGSANPYGLIQKGGKRRSKKTMRKKGKSRKAINTRKARKARNTRKYRC